jgi:hypothetical protein
VRPACACLLLAACGGPAFQAGEAFPDDAGDVADASSRPVLEHGFSDAQSETAAPAADVVDDAPASLDVALLDAAPAADVVDEPALPVCDPGACLCLYEGSVRCCVAAGGVTCL